jgi:hypothetical protein
MHWVLPNLLLPGITAPGLETCRTSCRTTCCVPLRSWCAKTAAPVAALRWPLPSAGLQLGLVPHPGQRQDLHHLHQPPQALPGPLRATSRAPPPRMAPWAAQSGHFPLAANGATTNTSGSACGSCNTIRAFNCAGRCEAAISTCAGARNRFLSQAPGFL